MCNSKIHCYCLHPCLCRAKCKVSPNLHCKYFPSCCLPLCVESSVIIATKQLLSKSISRICLTQDTNLGKKSFNPWFQGNFVQDPFHSVVVRSKIFQSKQKIILRYNVGCSNQFLYSFSSFLFSPHFFYIFCKLHTNS